MQALVWEGTGSRPLKLTYLCMCDRETLALLGLRDWQESLGPLASLDHLG